MWPTKIDPELDAAIDRAGRQRVFRLAEALGWSPAKPPPPGVWRGIVALVTLRELLKGTEFVSETCPDETCPDADQHSIFGCRTCGEPPL